MENLLKEFLVRENDKEWFERIKRRVVEMGDDIKFDEELLRELYSRESDKEWLDRIRNRASKIKSNIDRFHEYMY